MNGVLISLRFTPFPFDSTHAINEELQLPLIVSFVFKDLGHWETDYEICVLKSFKI